MHPQAISITAFPAVIGDGDVVNCEGCGSETIPPDEYPASPSAIIQISSGGTKKVGTVISKITIINSDVVDISGFTIHKNCITPGMLDPEFGELDI